MSELQGRGTAVRSAITALARVRWFAPFGMAMAERFVNRALAQVTSYFTDEQTRAHALDQVAQLIGPDTRLLVGHSLGSVVAYEAAHRLSTPLPLLVTLGSPLGLRTIVYERLRPQPPRFPPLVVRWVNVADREDFIAAAPDLTALFGTGQPTGALFEGGWTVDNGAQPHTATFYLTKRETARPIGQTLADA
jgi:pimeloyl-ACP methyl ester carboxylesterase